MSTIIFIDGGIGRVLCSIPALLKYNKLNPDKEWHIIVPAWEYLFWGIPELQNRSFHSETKGIFENYWLNAEEVISPEPYRVPEYYKNKISMAESFDFEINKTTDHSDLPNLDFFCSSEEVDIAYNVLKTAKESQGKDKTIVVQPYGSTANKRDYGIVDFSNRSIPEDFYEYLVDCLMEDYNVIYMGDSSLHDGKTFIPNPDVGIREWATIIQYCDYFIGCDSCGQHMAKAVNQKASVFIAGTHETNVSYPKDFHIIKKDLPFYPDTMRISGFSSNLSSRLNEQRVEFSEEEMYKHYKQIILQIESHSTFDFEEKNIDTNKYLIHN
jgi:hypothetical protein